MTQSIHHSAAAALHRPLPRRTGIALAAVLAASVFTACAAGNGGGSEPQRDDADAVTATDASPEPTWPTIKESGTGSTVVAFTRPDERARYLKLNFTCTAGTSRVELREDPRVRMSGTCDGGQDYQMNLPPGVDDLHLDITLDPGASFELRGRFTQE